LIVTSDHRRLAEIPLDAGGNKGRRSIRTRTGELEQEGSISPGMPVAHLVAMLCGFDYLHSGIGYRPLPFYLQFLRIPLRRTARSPVRGIVSGA
jgi:hypothetical protein